jgi:hypothetical protein
MLAMLTHRWYICMSPERNRYQQFIKVTSWHAHLIENDCSFGGIGRFLGTMFTNQYAVTEYHRGVNEKRNIWPGKWSLLI